MKRRLGVLAALLMAADAGFLAAQDPAQKIDLKVLYAGAPESRRTKDFTEFLGKTFAEVGDRRAQVARREGRGEVRRRDRGLALAVPAGHRHALGLQDAGDAQAHARLHEADHPHGRRRRRRARQPQDQAPVALTVPRRARPTVLDAAHEIFQKPFKVDLQLEEIDTPKNYRVYPDGENLPPKMMGVARPPGHDVGEELRPRVRRVRIRGLA